LFDIFVSFSDEIGYSALRSDILIIQAL